tara:strand:+ start:1174 stop:1440 length:267 start_codon:yes stop_codon:yes gene_type:complete
MPEFKKDTKGFKMKGWSPFTKLTDPTKKKPTAKVKSDKMQEANAEERAIMKQMAVIEGKMKGMDKNSSEYKKLMDKHRNLDNKLYPFD